MRAKKKKNEEEEEEKNGKIKITVKMGVKYRSVRKKEYECIEEGEKKVGRCEGQYAICAI